MSNESGFWKQFRDAMRPFGIMKRIENRLDLGTPDLSYCLRFRHGLPASGWIELKDVPAWPVNPHQPLVIRHLTLNQVLWLEEWGTIGRSWLLIRIGDEIMICNPAIARLIFKREISHNQLRHGATGLWSATPFPTRQLLEVLTG